MKFTLSWLKDHLETAASVDELATTLSAIGLEVDGIDDPAKTLGAFIVARIVEAKKHPNADKLQVVQVDIANGQPLLEVVCGAPNARAGMIAVFAPLGTHIPGLGITLEKKPVRGVVSNGMMCSASELQLGGDSAGILDLDEAAFAGKIGQRYVDAAGLSDPVFDVKLTPNRPDCTGVRGIARDLAAAGMGRFKNEQHISAVEGTKPCPIEIKLDFTSDTANACPVFAGRVVRGVRNGPSPDWLQARLDAVGLRPINALVDITNYISLDRGRPLHVYDADKLTGAISARLGRSGESFRALDGRDYAIDESMCVIADEGSVLGLGGIMGGEASGSTTSTTNVFIESAYFDPIRTAQTGRKTSLQTDARYRFERGVDPAFVSGGLDLATAMIVELCGGVPTEATVAGREPIDRREIDFDFSRVAKLTGVELEQTEASEILKALGFGVAPGSAVAKIAIPTWRPDIHGTADLVEEIVRIAGLDRVPSTPLPSNHGVARAVLTQRQRRARRVRRLLATRGLVEAVTWSFIPRHEAKQFGGGADALELANPISSELSSMRPGLLPGLLTAVTRNRNRGAGAVALFELGQAYRGPKPEDQYLAAAGVRAGTARLAGSSRHWDMTAEPVDAFDVKSDVFSALAALGFDPAKAQLSRDAPAWYHPGRSGALKLGPKTVLAYFGEIHPATLKELDVAAPVSGFELFLDALPLEKRRQLAKPPLAASELLPIARDFAFVVGQDVAAGDVIKAVLGADKLLIQSANVFDVFEGGNLAAEGKKSVALEVVVQPQSETLNDKAIDAISQKIVAAVKKATGGEIRV